MVNLEVMFQGFRPKRKTLSNYQKVKKMLIKHMVIFCLKYNESDSRTDKFLSDSKSILSSIPVVEKFKVLKQISPKNKFHFGFFMEFKDKEAYKTRITNTNKN